MQRPIYLDHHATTPIDPGVLDAMLPWFSERFGNPASEGHAYGWEAAAAVERAREQLAALLHGDPAEVVFTSGATEADNLALKGVVAAYGRRGRHLVISAIEHPAVHDTAAALARAGAEITELPVGPDGLVAPSDVARALRDDTVLVSVIHANNEIGTLQPLAEIGAITRARGVLLHTDAAQSGGREPLDLRSLPVDLVSLSAHKMYGPKGIGALWLRRRNPRVRVVAQIDGGGHERGRRSGTLPTPLVVGLGEACQLAQREMSAEQNRQRALRDRLLAGILAGLDGVRVNGSLRHRLAGNLNLSFEGVDGSALLPALRGVALSSGSACSSAAQQPSRVLRAIGLDDPLARASLRFGLGRDTTAEQIEQVIEQVVAAVRSAR